jgi:L-ascorbate metabolism protein UlaG (beta-lactamase superfamily)
MSRKYLYILILGITLALNGCWVSRLAVNSIGDSIFDTPQKVTKLNNPLLDSVRISVLWAGHSTSLVQIYDKVIIFDPFFNKRFNGILLRKTELGLNVDSLNRLDAILVSHSHIDHLSFSSLDILANKFPKATLVFPVGVENYMPDYKINMIRVDKSDTKFKNFIGKPVYVNGLKITPVFAFHPGGRYMFDTYTWLEEGATGFIVEYKDACVYYAGDTGYNDKAFKVIGENFKIDLALIPIGPCRNCDSTGIRYHTSSLESLELFKDIKADYMIPVHYGAARYFNDENIPLYVMNQILNDSTYSYQDIKDRVIPLKEGERIFWKEKRISDN